MLETGLLTYIETFPGLVAIQGTRVWPLVLPQKPVLPCTVYQRIDTAPEYSHSGPVALENIRMQLSCWATKLTEAKALAEQYRQALGGFSGEMGNQTVGASFVVNIVDNYDDETGLFRVIVDVRLWHKT